MKEGLLFIAFVISGIFCSAQDSLSNGNRFQLGYGAGVGMAVMGGPGFAFTGHLQAENRFTRGISAFMSTECAILVGNEGGLIFPIQIGPRVYVSNGFFAGIGIGYYLMRLGNQRGNGGYTYYPHIGYNGNKSQIVFGFDVFKFHNINYYYDPLPAGQTVGLIEIRATLDF